MLRPVSFIQIFLTAGKTAVDTDRSVHLDGCRNGIRSLPHPDVISRAGCVDAFLYGLECLGPLAACP